MSTYSKDHKLAKLIVFFMVSALLITNRYYNVVILDVIAVFIWFFAVNPVGYAIEHFLDHEHKHEKV